MKKVSEQELEKTIGEIMQKGDAADIVGLLKELQDASGLKICQNPNSDDLAYRKIE